MLISRLLLIAALSAAAASAETPASRLKSNYGLALKTQQLTEALVRHQSRDVYRMFAPAFAREHSFARFDSALNHWYGGRRVLRASHKVVDIKGPSGYVSSWFVFEGRKDYDYVYQNWLNTGQGWQLLWMSRILDQDFAYGQGDSAALVRIAEAGLRYLLSRAGLAQFKAGYRRPHTVVMLAHSRPGEGEYRLDSGVVKWVTREELGTALGLTQARFYLDLGLVRQMGDIALASFDLTPVERDRNGKPRRPRGMEVYVELVKGAWRFRDVGKIW
jgi:hypothetical protein